VVEEHVGVLLVQQLHAVVDVFAQTVVVDLVVLLVVLDDRQAGAVLQVGDLFAPVVAVEVLEDFGHARELGLHLLVVGVLEPDQRERVAHERGFDGLVERGRGGERGQAVDFDEQRVEVLVDQDVEAEDLEAALLLRAQARDRVLDQRLDRDAGLDAHVADALLEHVGLAAGVRAQLLQPLLLGPLRGAVVLRAAARLLAGRVLVHGLVGQVREAVVLVVLLLLVRREPHEPLLELVDAQGVEGGDQDLDAQVLLLVADEVRLHDVARDDGVVLVLDLRVLVDHLDALAAGHVAGLDDPELLEVALLGLVAREARLVRGQDLGERALVEVLGAPPPEVDLVLLHPVLAAQLLAAGEVVDLLLGQQLAQLLRLHGHAPEQVPLLALAVLEARLLQAVQHRVLPVRLQHALLQLHARRRGRDFGHAAVRRLLELDRLGLLEEDHLGPVREHAPQQQHVLVLGHLERERMRFAGDSFGRSLSVLGGSRIAAAGGAHY